MFGKQRVYSINKEEVTHFSHIISVQVEKIEAPRRFPYKKPCNLFTGCPP